MAKTNPSNWIKMILIILCMQMLSNSIVLPYLFAVAPTVNATQKNNLTAQNLQNMLHIGDASNQDQEDAPLESEDGEIEKKMSVDAVELTKREILYTTIRGLHVIPLDNSAASLYQPELNTPPPKTA